MSKPNPESAKGRIGVAGRTRSDPSRTQGSASGIQPTRVLIAWVGVPCIALIAVSLDARPSLNWPTPPQAWAAAAVLWTHAILAGLLYKGLLATPAGLASAVALAVPPVLAAASLGQISLTETLLPQVWLAAWLIALHILARATRRRPNLIATLAATLPATLAVLAYLQAESGGSGWPSTFLPPTPDSIPPSTSLPRPAPLLPFALPAVVACLAASIWLSTTLRPGRRLSPHNRPPEHTLSTTKPASERD